MLRQEVVDHARTYLGIPWRHRGRTLTGIDCVGLLVLVGRHFGCKVRDVEGYARVPNGTMLGHLDYNFTRAVDLNPKVGQIGTFRDGGHRMHVGIISEKYRRLHLVHATLDRGQVYEEPLDQRLMGNLGELFDFPGVED